MIYINKKAGHAVGIWNKNYILCMCVAAASSFGHSMFNPALPVYAKSLGIATDMIGTIVAIALFLCMIGRGVIGGYADKVDKKKLVFVSLFILLAGYICYFFADNVPGILIARTLQAVGFGMNNTVLSAMAFSTVPQEKLASAIGIFSLASSLTQTIAPNVGTNIAYAGNFRFLFVLATTMTVVSIIILGQIKMQSVEKAGNIRGRTVRISDYICTPAIPAAAMLMFNGIVYSSISNYLSLYGLEKGLTGIGMFFSINAIFMMVTRPMVGKLCDTKPLALVMIPGFLATILTCILLSIAPNMAVIGIAAAFYGFGFGSTQAAIQIMALRSVGPERRGAANATFYIGGDLGLSTGSYLDGVLATIIGYSKMYLVMAVVAGISFTYFLVSKTIHKKTEWHKKGIMHLLKDGG